MNTDTFCCCLTHHRFFSSDRKDLLLFCCTNTKRRKSQKLFDFAFHLRKFVYIFCLLMGKLTFRITLTSSMILNRRKFFLSLFFWLLFPQLGPNSVNESSKRKKKKILSAQAINLKLVDSNFYINIITLLQLIQKHAFLEATLSQHDEKDVAGRVGS